MFSSFKNKINILFWIPLIVLLGVSLWKSVNFQIHDFANYYFGAKLLVANQFLPETYNALHFNNYIEENFSGNIFASFYPNTPGLAMLYAPLVSLEVGIAKLIFNIFSILFFIYTIFDFQKTYKLPVYFTLLVPLLFFHAIKDNLLFGQCYLVLVGLIYFGFKAIELKRFSFYHIFWPLGILLKSSPIILFGFLLFGRKYKSLLIQLVLLSLLIIFTVLATNVEVCQYYITEVFFKASRGDIYNGFTVRAKSFEMLFKQLFYHESLLNPLPVFSSIKSYVFVKTLLKVFLLLNAIYFTLKNEISDFAKLGLWILVLILMSPTMSSYSMVLLTIPYAAILTRSNTTTIIITTLLILVITNYPYPYFYESNNLLLVFGKAIFSLLLFIAYLVSLQSDSSDRFIRSQNLIYFSGCLAIPLIVAFASNTNTIRNAYVLKEENDIMMTNFSINNNQLHLIYKTNQAPKRVSYPIEFKINKTIDNYQIPKESSFNIRNHNVIKSILINDSIIYYMTDVNRSPGFYTLKKVKVNEAE